MKYLLRYFFAVIIYLKQKKKLGLSSVMSQIAIPEITGASYTSTK